jgi:hypothetical protein
VDPRTGLIRPWFADRPDRGNILCHPVAAVYRFQDCDLFLSLFITR